MEEVMDNLLFRFIAGFLVVVVFAVVYGSIRRRRKRKQMTDPTNTASIPPPSIADDVGDKPAKAAKPLDREQREVDVRARQQAGLCTFCDKAAAFSRPDFVEARPVLDSILRAFNAVPKNAWKLRLFPLTPPALCEEHFIRRRLLLEEELLATQHLQAGVADRICLRLDAFVRYEADEQMKSDVDKLKRGKPNKKDPSSQAGTVLSVVRDKAAGDRG